MSPLAEDEKRPQRLAEERPWPALDTPYHCALYLENAYVAQQIN